LLAEKDAVIAELRRDKAFLQEQVKQFLSQLQETQAKLHAMLPGPGPKRWWQFWR